ncbi:MAG: cupredoxin domain-containing protein [Acidimicrobiia bacterium]|nr:cupredoxin domain-containing protein [Acidimicrobiia bacterium]
MVIDDFAFGDGQPLEVQQGKIVTWQNEDSVRHTVTSEDDVFSSDGLQPGDSFQQQFDEPGEYPYFCNIHPDRMEGTIVVLPADG